MPSCFLVAAPCLALGASFLTLAQPIARQPDVLDLLESGTDAHWNAAIAVTGQPPPATVLVVNAILADNGDGDGFADSNETVRMRLTLLNRTGVALTGLVARIATVDAKIACIADPLIEVGALGAGETIVTTDSATFLVADVGRTDVEEVFAASFIVTMSADQLEALPVSELTLTLDLDVTGGAGPTVFFESFESGFGQFTTMHLDEELNPPDHDLTNHALGSLNSDGYRCQYNDPDWENSNSLNGTTCYLSPNGEPDHFWFHVTDDRSFSGEQTLHWGVLTPQSWFGGFTTPLGQLEALRTLEPINLGWGKVCSVTRTTTCSDVVDCPVDEDCVQVNPVLSFKHQIRQEDLLRPDDRLALDRAVVQVQVAGNDGSPIGSWTTLQPFLNPYDSDVEQRYTNCRFDPIDDGNTEDDFFDPTDPERRLGPSSTCAPERVFAHQGDTFHPFDPESVGDATDGPGLEGETGLGTWVEPSFDLRAFLGRRIRIRFLETTMVLYDLVLWSETYVSDSDLDEGWFIDDVFVTDTLIEPAAIAVDVKDNTSLKADWDFDGFGATCDCAPHDVTAWAVPGEILDLRLSHDGGVDGVTTLAWSPATAEPGGTVFRYDVIRSAQPDDFALAAYCLESDEGADTTALDSVTPPPGSVHYYLVRAEHACGSGTAGTTSAGVAREVMGCPPSRRTR